MWQWNIGQPILLNTEGAVTGHGIIPGLPLVATTLTNDAFTKKDGKTDPDPFADSPSNLEPLSTLKGIMALAQIVHMIAIWPSLAQIAPLEVPVTALLYLPLKQ